MRLNYFVESNNQLTNRELAAAGCAFFEKFKVRPETIRLTLKDYQKFLHDCYAPMQYLEKGKVYGAYIPVPGGMAELGILEEEATYGTGIPNTYMTSNQVMIVVESNELDREFENHVLNGK